MTLVSFGILLPLSMVSSREAARGAWKGDSVTA